jgi:hypothetical protein
VKKAKFFLARILVEVDVTNRLGFEERQATDYFSSVFFRYVAMTGSLR